MKWTSVIALSYLMLHIGLGCLQMVSSQSYNNVIQTEQADSENDCLENDSEDMDQADETEFSISSSALLMHYKTSRFLAACCINSRKELPETPPPIVLV
ncbi:MAG: hypothetical protein RLZZ60_640 [Bacteroidota bacterium]|jgi:hypothetical protein